MSQLWRSRRHLMSSMTWGVRRFWPNDVLRELENFTFEIPELGGVSVTASAAMLPIVIITSNAERALPDAFLRRCVFHHMPFPERTLLERIVLARVSGMKF